MPTVVGVEERLNYAASNLDGIVLLNCSHLREILRMQSYEGAEILHRYNQFGVPFHFVPLR